MAKHILTSFGLTDKYIAQFGNIMRRQLSFYRSSSAYCNSNFKEYAKALKTIVETGYRAITVADRASRLLDNYLVFADRLCVKHGKFDNMRIYKNIGVISRTIPEMVSEAVNIYLVQIVLNRGIPFAIKIPNKTTMKTFEETDRGKNVLKAKNVREIFKKAKR